MRIREGVEVSPPRLRASPPRLRYRIVSLTTLPRMLDLEPAFA
jgi:hypothetical protein